MVDHRGVITSRHVGYNPGDEVKIEVQQEKDMVKYLVKINKIEEQILPKVDNAFATLLDKNLCNIVAILLYPRCSIIPTKPKSLLFWFLDN